MFSFMHLERCKLSLNIKSRKYLFLKANKQFYATFLENKSGATYGGATILVIYWWFVKLTCSAEALTGLLSLTPTLSLAASHQVLQLAAGCRLNTLTLLMWHKRKISTLLCQ